MFPERVYLIGMMGSGKTSAGRILASLIGYSFKDFDALIEEKEKMPVREIFSKLGEKKFREIEAELLLEYSLGPQHVLSTGGGIVLNPASISLMKKTGAVVYLETSLSQLETRLEGNSSRPLLAGTDWKKSLEEILLKRRPLYESAASIKITTDGKSPQEVASNISEKLKKL